jgi:hypothetical protein
MQLLYVSHDSIVYTRAQDAEHILIAIHRGGEDFQRDFPGGFPGDHSDAFKARTPDYLPGTGRRPVAAENLPDRYVYRRRGAVASPADT